MGCNYTDDINKKLVHGIAVSKLLEMDKFPDQSPINRFLNRFGEANINQLEFIHYNLITLIKNITFNTSDFENIGTRPLVKKLGTITARIIKAENHIRIVLPNYQNYLLKHYGPDIFS